jgi:hypothetical protein
MASAAGVSLLALASPAEGKIVYTHAHKKLPIHKHFFLDVNHDRINDFRFDLAPRSENWLWQARELQGNELSTFRTRTRYSTFPCARALPKGVKVGPNSPFKALPSSATMAAAASSFANHCSWQNVGGGQAYLALKVSINGKIHFGWARFGDVYINAGGASATLTGYAYETVPNKPIITGRTKGPDVITLEPGSLGRLAQGSRGLAAWRRKESASGTH